MLLFVCLFVVVAVGAAADVGGMVVVVLCLQCHFASDKLPPPHLTTISVCLKMLTSGAKLNDLAC